MDNAYKFMERRLRGKQSPSEIVQFNQDPSKPNVGCKPRLEALIECTRTHIRNVTKKMAVLGQELRRIDTIDTGLLDEYQKLNTQLKGLKVYEAEIVYLNNML